VSLRTVAQEWGRIGCVGFGGQPTHVALFRELCVTRRRRACGSLLRSSRSCHRSLSSFGAERFERLLLNERVTAFLTGVAPASAGAIIGSAIPLADALSETWQYVMLATAIIALLALCRSIVLTLLSAGTVGAVAGLLGAPLRH
jgi:chromate transport protein ChrA